MSVDQLTLNRAISAAKHLEAQGYFEKVRQGDQKAASLFARLTAYELNPQGLGSDYGWLSKSPGESQVDGYAEDAICYGNDPNDRMNVVDLINGAGAPGASIGGAVKERRAHNLWVKPVKLSDADMLYLRVGIPDPVPQPPVIVIPPFPPRNETMDFGLVLNDHYGLKGASVNGTLGGRFGDKPRFTDYEGEIIWTSEYLRRRQLGETHEQATRHVIEDVNAAWPK